jgi:hypothetical protein
MVDQDIRINGVRFEHMGKGVRMAHVTFDVGAKRTGDLVHQGFLVEVCVYVINNDESAIFAQARKAFHDVMRSAAAITVAWSGQP